jgi:hypothetical protein
MLNIESSITPEAPNKKKQSIEDQWRGNPAYYALRPWGKTLDKYDQVALNYCRELIHKLSKSKQEELRIFENGIGARALLIRLNTNDAPWDSGFASKNYVYGIYWYDDGRREEFLNEFHGDCLHLQALPQILEAQDKSFKRRVLDYREGEFWVRSADQFAYSIEMIQSFALDGSQPLNNPNWLPYQVV